MTYEYCLEYGNFPVKETNICFITVPTPPDFLKDDTDLITRLTEMNTLFHELFLSLEGDFIYIGQEFPEKIATLKPLYEQLGQELQAKYGKEIDITIEPLYI